jgi:DNA-binding NarL/FixJ family response regulator
MKVLLIDDHPLILAALQIVIEGLGNGTTVTTASSAAKARETLVLNSDFDLVLLDLHLGDANGFDVLDELRSQYPALPVVVVSASDQQSDVIRAIDAGAMGFVPKRADHETLCDALNMVMSGGIYVPMAAELDAYPHPNHQPTQAGELQTAFDSTLDDTLRPTKVADLGLTPRQTEVLALLLKGNSNKLIARELHLSVETVKDHVAAVLRTLGVSTRTQAVLVVSQMSSRRTIPGGLSTFLNSFR